MYPENLSFDAFETRLTVEGGPVLGLGARHLDIGQGDVPWVMLADPSDNALCVLPAQS